jgi:hypothetical protein
MLTKKRAPKNTQIVKVDNDGNWKEHQLEYDEAIVGVSGETLEHKLGVKTLIFKIEKIAFLIYYQ